MSFFFSFDIEPAFKILKLFQHQLKKGISFQKLCQQICLWQRNFFVVHILPLFMDNRCYRQLLSPNYFWEKTINGRNVINSFFYSFLLFYFLPSFLQSPSHSITYSITYPTIHTARFTRFEDLKIPHKNF